MRVLAIDPGLTRCGIGVIESTSMSLVAVGVLKSSADDSIEQRLMEIDSQIREWISIHTPDVIAIEEFSRSRTCGRLWGRLKLQESHF